MNDIGQLAQQAVTVLVPLLPVAAAAVAGHVIDGFLEQPGSKLFDWLTAQFQGKPAAATLERAVTEPQNTHRLEALRLEIDELVEKDPEFRRQLAELLKELTPTADTVANQTANPIGDSNKIAQAAGTDIKIQIS